MNQNLEENDTAKNTVYEIDLADKIKIENYRAYRFSFNQCVCNLCEFFLNNMHFSNLKAVIDSHCDSYN